MEIVHLLARDGFAELSAKAARVLREVMGFHGRRL
jgi:hypothetical protein